ncbi:MAG: hypothetical protein HYX63_22115 [Gammaproteobacteria bacterium]|nr:hypothetical protein [Gammaproteobacteria bacterium]
MARVRASRGWRRQIFRFHPVPPGFTITTEAYAAFIRENALAEKIAPIVKGLNYDDFEDLERRTEEIRALVVNATFTADLHADIEQRYRALGIAAVLFGVISPDAWHRGFRGVCRRINIRS